MNGAGENEAVDRECSHNILVVTMICLFFVFIFIQLLLSLLLFLCIELARLLYRLYFCEAFCEYLFCVFVRLHLFISVTCRLHYVHNPNGNIWQYLQHVGICGSIFSTILHDTATIQ